MNLVLLTHPPTLGSASMPRFAGMIASGMQQRGHFCQLWTSTPKLARLPLASPFMRKWLGYWDQFVSYPRQLRRAVLQQSQDTLFVLTDQALGMWMPQLVDRPHVIHCHDFLALRSALGEFPENPTGWTGRQYQRLIRNGFSCGGAFISVSSKTKADLNRFLPGIPQISEVAYNGLNHPFRPMELPERISKLKAAGLEVPEAGFLLHVGGNQWYKNRIGVLEIYRAYVAATTNPIPLWMIGSSPTLGLSNLAASIPNPGKVHFVTELTNEQVNAAYSHARALLFPSLEEGFGWPIVEAMASGCPVITTNVAPLTEVAGAAARMIPRMPKSGAERKSWARSAAEVLAGVINPNAGEREAVLQKGFLHAARFDADTALASYERIYQRVLAQCEK